MSPRRAPHASAAGARAGTTRFAPDSHEETFISNPRVADDDAPASDRAHRAHPPRARMDTPFVGARAPRMDAPSDRVRTPWDARRVPAQRDTAALPIGRGRRRQDSAFPHAARGFFRDAAANAGGDGDPTAAFLLTGSVEPGDADSADSEPGEPGASGPPPRPRRSSARRGTLTRSNVLFAPRAKATPRWKRAVLSAFEGSAGASFMTAVALWTLFGDDARLAAFDAEDDHAFVAVTYACLALFTAEMCALCVAKEGYAFGFYFWLDLVATASLLLDVPEFMDASGLRSPALCDFVESASGGLDVLAAPDAVAQADDDGETVDGAFLRAARASRAGTRARGASCASCASRACFDCAGCGARTRRRRRAGPRQRWTRRDVREAIARRLPTRLPSRIDQRSRSTPRKKNPSRRCASAATSERGDPELSVAIVETVETTEGRGDILDVVVVKDDVKDEKARDRDAPGGDAPKPPQTKSSSETRVGQRLSELTTRRVIVGVLGMLFALPWFDLDTYPSLTEASFKDSGLRVLHAFAAGAESGGSETRANLSGKNPGPGFYGAVDQYWRGADGLYALVVYGESLDAHADTAFTLPGADFGRRLRCEEFRLAAYVADLEPETHAETHVPSVPSYAFFDARVATRTQAALNMCRTVFVCLMLGAGALFFSRDAHALVLKPIERMVKKVREVSENPLKRFAVDDKSDESDGDADDDAHFAERREDGKGSRRGVFGNAVFEFFSRDGFARRRTRQVLNGRASVKKSSRRYRDDSQMETRLLENSIAKICGLLAVGFGEAGSEIIAANIRRGGEIDPMIPGKKVVAIFGFCDIRQFTDTTEVLQEGVMEFVNTIGKIVHMETHLHGGSANKNVGDAFLLVWKFPAEVTLEDVERPERAPPGRRAAVAKVCEGALASFVAIIAGLRRSAKLNAYSNDARLAARMPDFEVKMGFGLHVGWAIEGAIGSEYKVDASYLSPNVNLSARLEAATKQFDVPILISERFVNACGTSVARACRQIDRVTVKGSEEPMGVFTFDVAHDAAPAPDAPEDPERFLVKKKTASERARGGTADAASNEGTNVQSHSFYKYDDAFAEHPDLVAMRRGVTEEFLEKFRAAFALYREGRWAEAASALRPAAAGAWRRDAKGRPVEDGPAKALLRHMETCAFEAPAEWRGFRALTEK